MHDVCERGSKASATIKEGPGRARMIFSIIILFAFGVSAFENAPAWDFPLMPSVLTSIQRRDKPVDEQDIREAVFRYQFNHNSSGQQQNAKVYFLSLNQGRSPGNDLMIRFKGNKPPVRKVSEASVSARGVVDKKTGRRGLVFRITEIKWLGENDVEVEGGYFESGQSASTNVYKVKRESGRWVVKEDKVLEIS
jgi:hypothetical protein